MCALSNGQFVSKSRCYRDPDLFSCPGNIGILSFFLAAFIIRSAGGDEQRIHLRSISKISLGQAHDTVWLDAAHDRGKL